MINTNTPKHISFSRVHAKVLQDVNIELGLLLAREKKIVAEEQGLDDIEGRALSMDVLRDLIGVVCPHVAVSVHRTSWHFSEFCSLLTFARLKQVVEC